MQKYFIGIKKLPDVAGKLSDGRVYVVMHDAGMELQLACRTLVDGSAMGQTEWVTETPSAYQVLPMDLKQSVSECLNKGSLRIFHRQMASGDNICRRILNELDFIGVTAGSLIVVERIDHFLEQAIDDEAWAEDVAIWQRWVERTACSVLWMCQKPVNQTGFEDNLLNLAHRFSGIARLRQTGDEVYWNIFYWFTKEGLLVDKSFKLNVDSNGDWSVNDNDMLRAEAPEHIVDEDEVFILRQALPEKEDMPEGWHVFETIADLEAALASSLGPTVVFDFGLSSSLEMLANSIYKLREAIGPYIKIVVKGVGKPLRHSHEQLLLSIGANLTIASKNGIVRMQSQLASIQGQVYSRTLPLSFDEAMSSFTKVMQMGYCAPRDFCEAVRDVMGRIHSLGLRSALVHLSLTPGLGVLETLRCCTVKRQGDLVTADNDSLYVFLSSCDPQDIGLTFDHLFQLPISVLFSAEIRYLTASDISEALYKFDRCVAKLDLEDLSSALKSVSLTDTQLSTSFISSTVSTLSAGSGITAMPYILPVRDIPV